MLPQSDYNAIDSGNNGYAAGAGYNLVTGLGTPVASLLVPALVAYQGPGTTYSGPTVAPLQDASLVNNGTSNSSPMDVFSVFDSVTVPERGLGLAQHAGPVNEASIRYASPLQPTVASPQDGNTYSLGSVTGPEPAGVALSSTGGTTGTQVPVRLMPEPSSCMALQPGISFGSRIASKPMDLTWGVVPGEEPISLSARYRVNRSLMSDSALYEIAADVVSWRGIAAVRSGDAPVLPSMRRGDAPVQTDPKPERGQSDQSSGYMERLAVAAVTVGLWSYRCRATSDRKRPSR